MSCCITSSRFSASTFTVYPVEKLICCASFCGLTDAFAFSCVKNEASTALYRSTDTLAEFVIPEIVYWAVALKTSATANIKVSIKVESNWAFLFNTETLFTLCVEELFATTLLGYSHPFTSWYA